MSLLEEIRRRYSVRKFSEQPVEREKIDTILDAGRLSPSAKNRQAWRFIVVTEEQLRKNIENACFGQDWVGTAPCQIALCTTNVDYKMPNGQLSYPVDLGIAAGFMMIQAVHDGLGTCAITTFREQEVKSLLTVPYSMRVVMILLVGYPSPEEEEERSRRFPLDRVSSYNHW
ncbi:MAG: nitroreductase family protein [Alkalispirochaetaceae bacterium]